MTHTPSHLTATQIGAIGEALVASQLLLASDGRLTPFQPIADDDGIDLLVFDKRTRRPASVQVKARTGVDKAAGTVQFDVRRQTFNAAAEAWVLAILLDAGRTGIERAWLVPMDQLAAVSQGKPDKLVLVASPKATSKDQWTPYRCDSMAEVAARLIAHFDQVAVGATNGTVRAGLPAAADVMMGTTGPDTRRDA